MAAITQVRTRAAAIGKRGLISRGGQRAAERVIPARVALHSMKHHNPPLDRRRGGPEGHVKRVAVGSLEGARFVFRLSHK